DGARAVASAEAMVRRTQDRLRVPQSLAGTEFYLSASFGISVYPLDADDRRSLLKNADAAMYESKKSAPGGYTVYASPAFAGTRLSMITRLRKAVDERQWELRYQPVVTLPDRRPTSVEALLRWQEPGGTLIQPNDFIASAEEMGLMPAIGEWVVEELCR